MSATWPYPNGSRVKITGPSRPRALNGGPTFVATTFVGQFGHVDSTGPQADYCVVVFPTEVWEFFPRTSLMLVPEPAPLHDPEALEEWLNT